MVVPPAEAVGEAVSGPPLMTVTSGLAVALGVGPGASTHLVTFSDVLALRGDAGGAEGVLREGTGRDH
jgi:hypothetical protein